MRRKHVRVLKALLMEDKRRKSSIQKISEVTEEKYYGSIRQIEDHLCEINGEDRIPLSTLKKVLAELIAEDVVQHKYGKWSTKNIPRIIKLAEDGVFDPGTWDLWEDIIEHIKNRGKIGGIQLFDLEFQKIFAK